MPDQWLAGATVRPGRNAHYVNGHTTMQYGVLHYTVGTDSTSIGDAGYFNILFPKVGPPIQFAEIDCLTWHAGPFNPCGPGAEWERMPTGVYVRPGLQEAEPLTPDQIHWGGRWIDLCTEWGIPRIHYPGPQFGATGFSGQVNHGDLDKDRSDGLTDAEWLAVVTLPVPTPTPKDTPVKMVPYNNTWLQFGVDTSGQLIQSTYDANLVLVPGAQDVVVLGGNRPSSDVTVDVLADARILVGSEDVNGKNRAVSYRPGLGWYDATGAKLP